MSIVSEGGGGSSPSSSSRETKDERMREGWKDEHKDGGSVGEKDGGVRDGERCVNG